jgi:serine/threonine protein phosphatase PrpC
MTSESFETQLADWLLRKTGNGAVRRVADLPIAVASSVGLVRKDNQDRVAVLRFLEQSGQQSILIAICDGMGGMADGTECAATALSSFFSAFVQSSARLLPRDRLFQAASYANQSVYKLYRGSGGATLSAVLMQSDSPAIWVNVGDSRIYRFENRLLNQITVDDTLAGQLAREPAAYAGRSELLQFIGIGPMAEPHVGDFEKFTEQSALMITSDGAHFLPANLIQELMAHATEPAIAARRLMDVATWCGGHDNASIAIVYPEQVFAQDAPAGRSNFVEVWDAFGEVRFVNIMSENKLSSASHKHEGLPLQPQTSIPSPEPTESDLERKQRGMKSKKPMKKKSIDKNSSNNGGLVEPPQLMMNFRKKG